MIYPHISMDRDETVIEWWNKGRKISLYVSSHKNDTPTEMFKVYDLAGSPQIESVNPFDAETVEKAFKWLEYKA